MAVTREAIRLRPDDSATQYNLGLVLAARGEVEEAIAAFRMAIRLRPEFAEASSKPRRCP
ncbi:MAG: tetratricopeptide repeat protein [Isosphaeraceae bacterium]